MLGTPEANKNIDQALFENFCHGVCSEINHFYQSQEDRAKKTRPWHDQERAKRFADKTHHQYFHRLQTEEEARLRTSHVQGRALTVERIRQISENAQARNQRREEEDRRIAERERVNEEQQLRRSWEQIRRDLDHSGQASHGRPLTGHWIPTPRGQRWVSALPEISVKELAASLQRKFDETNGKRKEWEAKNREWERQEVEQLK